MLPKREIIKTRYQDGEEFLTWMSERNYEYLETIPLVRVDRNAKPDVTLTSEGIKDIKARFRGLPRVLRVEVTERLARIPTTEVLITVRKNPARSPRVVIPLSRVVDQCDTDYEHYGIWLTFALSYRRDWVYVIEKIGYGIVYQAWRFMDWLSSLK